METLERCPYCGGCNRCCYCERLTCIQCWVVIREGDARGHLEFMHNLEPDAIFSTSEYFERTYK